MQLRATLWLCVILASHGAEQTWAEPLRLTLEDAIARATSAHFDVIAARKDVRIAQANLKRSRALLPSNPFLFGGGQHTTQTGVDPNYTFFLSQEFEIAGQRGKRIAAAAANVAVATADRESVELNFVAIVKAAFVSALINGDRLTLARHSTDAATALAKQFETENPGAAPERISFNEARIYDTRMRRNLARVEQAHHQAFATVRRLLHLPAHQHIELIGTAEYAARDVPAAAVLVEQGLRQRPDLAALRHALERADLQLSLAKREAIPNVTVSASVSRFEGDTLTGGDIGFPIPLFQGQGPNIEEAVADHERAAAQLEDLKAQVEQEVVEAHRAVVVAAEDLQAFAHQIVPRMEENLQLKRGLYERGEATLLDVIGLEIDVLDVRREHLDAVQAYNDALFELERVTGGSVPPGSGAAGND